MFLIKTSYLDLPVKTAHLSLVTYAGHIQSISQFKPHLFR